MIKKCSCSGPVCSCGAEGIVKDGAAVRVHLSAMDEAPKTPEPNLVGDAGEAWGKSVFDRAHVPMKSNNDNGAAKKQPVGDATDPWATAIEDHNGRRG